MAHIIMITYISYSVEYIQLTPSFVQTANPSFGATSSPKGTEYLTSTSSDGTSNTGGNFILAANPSPGRSIVILNGSALAA